MEPVPSHFLLVDDDDDHAELVIQGMKRGRVCNTLDRVRDGVEAMDYLYQRGPYASKPRPDVVLLDLNMPRMGGHEVIEKVRGDPRLCFIPIVVLTTSDADGDRTRSYELHANSYLVKPINFQEFTKMAQELSLYWGVWNRPPLRAADTDCR